MNLVTIPNVEIVSTGTYQLSSGEATFTAEHLAAAVQSQDDPAVLPPRIKLGHTSEFGDAEPAFGKVLNMRLSADGQTLIGDFVGVPEWLADVMATAFPSRSIEGSLNASTDTGSTHDLLLTAVSLLGVVMPGVSTLADLADQYGAEMPEGTQVLGGTPIAASVGSRSDTVQASVNLEDVRWAYYESLSAGQEWWWIREMFVDPLQLIVDSDGDGLLRVPVTVEGSNISFGDPIPVEVVYVDRTEAAEKVEAAKAVSSCGQSVAVFASREQSRDKKEQEQEMDGVKLRESMGLPAEATDEEVLEKSAELAKAAEGVAEGDKPDGEVTPEAVVETPEPVAAAKGDDDEDDNYVRVPKETWAEVQAGAQKGAKVATDMAVKDKNDTITAAIRAGKFAKSRKEHYEAAWDRDPEGTKNLLTASVEQGGLAPNLVPVEEASVEASSEGGTTAEYPQELFPEIAARQSGDNNLVTKE